VSWAGVVGAQLGKQSGKQDCYHIPVPHPHKPKGERDKKAGTFSLLSHFAD